MSQGTSPLQAVRLRDGRQTREAILHAATELMHLKGYQALYEVAST